MKRAFLFLLLGPMLCVTILCVPIAVHSPAIFPQIFLQIAPIMFLVAVGLMAIAGAVDWSLSNASLFRIIGSALAAFAAVLIFQDVTDSLTPIIGLAGAIPAAICSWLSGGKPNEAKDA